MTTYFINISEEYPQYILFYDDDKNFIYGIGAVKETSPNNAAYVRFCVHKNRQRDFILTENVPYFENLSSYIEVGEWVNGNILMASDGSIGRGDDKKFKTSGYTDISMFNKLLYFGCARTGIPDSASIAFYDENKEFINSKQYLGYDEDSVILVLENVPDGAKYVRFCTFIGKQFFAHGFLDNTLQNECDHSNDEKKHIRFMVFGNSYGMDSITYVPFILKNLGITSEIYLYRRDACSLRDIYNRWESANEKDTETDGIHAGTYMRALYCIDTRKDTSWKQTDRISMKECVELGNWDFITLQQWSAYSIDESSYEPWLPLVIDLIRQSVDKPTQLAWTQVWTRATHDDKQASLTAFQNVPYKKYPFDFYIPCGTSIFNARANETLAELGDCADKNFWKDSVHLQDGLPRYIASLTVCEAICRKFFPNISVMYDKTRPTDDVIASWGNYMAMKPSVGITEENCLLAQYSAINACNHMFEVVKTESLPEAPERPSN